MTSVLKAPKASATFWISNVAYWFILATLNFANRNMQNVESIEQGLYSATGLFILCFLTSLLLRETCHQLNCHQKYFGALWKYLVFLALIFGLLCAFLNVAWAASYFIIAGYTTHWVIFWIQVQNNWFYTSVLMFIWAIVYLAAYRFNELNQIEREHNKLKESQLNTLISQLNPHFLFNGLNNIRSLILEDVDKARDMLTNLADILRYSLLSHKHATRPLSEELEIVTLYIELAKIQYEERLDYETSIEPSLLNQAVPSMIIQLLIENAVRHGIDRSKHGGKLFLRVNHCMNTMKIQVSNSGTLAASQDKDSIYEKSKMGIGIANIQSRLKLLYCNDASFSIRQDGKIVIATCKIPLNFSSNKQDDTFIPKGNEKY